MRRALAAGLLAGAIAAHAQAPPEAPAPAAAQGTAAETAPAPGEAPAAQTAPAPAPAAQPPPQPKPPAARLQPAKPPAPAREESAREVEVAALRQEVNRLQSELDAERAAALPAPEESAAGAPHARSPWGWLLVTALLALAAGFVLGWRLLDRRIRRKYGGLRIY